MLPPESPLPCLRLFGCSPACVVSFSGVDFSVGPLMRPCMTLVEVLARYPRRGEGRVPPPLSSPCSTLFGWLGGVVEGCSVWSELVSVGLWRSALWEGLLFFHGGRSTVVDCVTLLVPWRVLQGLFLPSLGTAGSTHGGSRRSWGTWLLLRCPWCAFLCILLWGGVLHTPHTLPSHGRSVGGGHTSGT